MSFPRPKPPPRMCLCWIAAIYLLSYLRTYFLTRIWICRQVGGILKWILTLHKIKATYYVEYLKSLVIEQLERELHKIKATYYVEYLKSLVIEQIERELHKIKFARSSHLQECVFMGFGMRTTKRMCQLSMQCAEVLKVRIARIVVTIGGKIGTLPWGHFSFVSIISLQTEIPWEILQRSLKLSGGERQHNRREKHTIILYKYKTEMIIKYK